MPDNHQTFKLMCSGNECICDFSSAICSAQSHKCSCTGWALLSHSLVCENCCGIIVYNPKECRGTEHDCVCHYSVQNLDLCRAVEHDCCCVIRDSQTCTIQYKPHICRSTKIHSCCCSLLPLNCSFNGNWFEKNHVCNCSQFDSVCRVHNYVPSVLEILWIMQSVDYTHYVQWLPREIMNDLFECIITKKS